MGIPGQIPSNHRTFRNGSRDRGSGPHFKGQARGGGRVPTPPMDLICRACKEF